MNCSAARRRTKSSATPATRIHPTALRTASDWFLELGFKAVKLFVPHGPHEGIEGLNKNVELIARTREQIGDDVELMLDAWISLNTEYVVRLSEALKPYRIKWLEDYLPPYDFDSYIKVRERIPHQILATGEHWHTIHPFALCGRAGAC